MESGAYLCAHDFVEVQFDRSGQSTGTGFTHAIPTDVESDTKSLDDNTRIRRRLTLNWVSTRESRRLFDSHNQRLARVRRQLQRDRSVEQPAPTQVVAMDMDDNSGGQHIQDNRRQWRGHCPLNNLSVSVPMASSLNSGVRSLDCVNLVDVFDIRRHFGSNGGLKGQVFHRV